MADNQRIDDFRRRVQKDPASIAFAQLAEELRRAGEHQESVDVCRAGLQIHPAYLSARVTLGRALLELNDLPDAQAELEFVLKSAPENLAAIRGLGEIHHRRGELPEALAQYRAALALARNDPDLQETVDQLSRQVEPQKPAPVDDGLSFDQMQNELLKLAPTPAPWEMPVAAAEPVAPSPSTVGNTAGFGGTDCSFVGALGNSADFGGHKLRLRRRRGKRPLASAAQVAAFASAVGNTAGFGGTSCAFASAVGNTAGFGGTSCAFPGAMGNAAGCGGTALASASTMGNAPGADGRGATGSQGRSEPVGNAPGRRACSIHGGACSARCVGRH